MAVLALLGIDTWTPYELVRHMTRSTIRHIWPRAESKMYAELKRLAAIGYAKASTDRHDPRRTQYTISPEGRRVLANWVAQPGTGVHFESEGALKVLFANNGTKGQLLATVDSIRGEALDTLERRSQVHDEVMTDGPPYPDRIHMSSLVMDLTHRITAAIVEWADLAEERVSQWPEVKPTDRMRADGMALVADLHARATAILETHPRDHTPTDRQRPAAARGAGPGRVTPRRGAIPADRASRSFP